MNLEEMSAYGISKTISDVIENSLVYNEETGDVYFTEDDLDKLKEELEEKINGICGYMKYAEGKADAFGKRIDEITKLKKRYESTAKSLKKYVNTLMIMNNKEKLDTKDFKISFRKSVSSEITDEDALKIYIKSSEELEKKYFKYSEPELNKKALSEDGTYTLEIPGFKLTENKNIQIQ